MTSNKNKQVCHWEGIKRAILLAQKNQDDVILIIEDTHRFTSSYNKKAFLGALIAAASEGVELLWEGSLCFSDKNQANIEYQARVLTSLLAIQRGGADSIQWLENRSEQVQYTDWLYQCFSSGRFDKDCFLKNVMDFYNSYRENPLYKGTPDGDNHDPEFDWNWDVLLNSIGF